jgi:hypothetical protein
MFMLTVEHGRTARRAAWFPIFTGKSLAELEFLTPQREYRNRSVFNS